MKITLVKQLNNSFKVAFESDYENIGVLKPIPDYEGLYYASENGFIISCKSELKIKNKRIQNNGYEMVDLWKNNKGKTLTVHRIIAKTFLKNEENKKCVNHKNGVKTDNRSNNLEWCTHSENQHHSLKLGLRKTLKIRQEDLSGNLINRFNSLKEASKITGISKSSISRVVNKRRNETYGFKFYKE